MSGFSCYTKFRYIIRGNGSMAVPVHSDMNWLEMDEWVRERCEKIHPKSHDRLLRLGGIELVNPEVMTVDDFANSTPMLIGVQ